MTEFADLSLPTQQILKTNDHITYGKYSVTDLINPVRVVWLKRRHRANIEQDMNWIKRTYAVRGTLLHSILEKAGKDKRFINDQPYILATDIAGCAVTVSGIPDLIDLETETLWDYKDTNVYSVTKGSRSQWEKQLNCYRYLILHGQAIDVEETRNIWRLNGGRNCGCVFLQPQLFEVKALKIEGWARDWKVAASKQDKNYPDESEVIDIPVWPDEKTKEFIERALCLLESTEVVPDGQLPVCTSAERWGNKRCQDYCDPCQYCKHYMELINGKSKSDNTNQ